MADILSFSKHKKRKERLEKIKCAEENRVNFGRTKAEKKSSKTKKNKEGKTLDDHKLDD